MIFSEKNYVSKFCKEWQLEFPIAARSCSSLLCSCSYRILICSCSILIWSPLPQECSVWKYAKIPPPQPPTEPKYLVNLYRSTLSPLPHQETCPKTLSGFSMYLHPSSPELGTIWPRPRKFGVWYWDPHHALVGAGREFTRTWLVRIYRRLKRRESNGGQKEAYRDGVGCRKQKL